MVACRDEIKNLIEDLPNDNKKQIMKINLKCAEIFNNFDES